MCGQIVQHSVDERLICARKRLCADRGRRLEENSCLDISGQLGLGTRFRQQDTRAQLRAVNLGRWRPQETLVLGPEVVGSNPTGPTTSPIVSLQWGTMNVAVVFGTLI